MDLVTLKRMSSVLYVVPTKSDVEWTYLHTHCSRMQSQLIGCILEFNVRPKLLSSSVTSAKV